MHADGLTSSSFPSGKDHRLVWEGRPALSEYVFLWFFAVLSAIRGAVVFVLPMGDLGSGLIYFSGTVLFIGLALFLQRTTRYAVTRAAVHQATGLLGRGEKIIPLENITATSVEQGPLDRLFGIGTLLLHLKEGERADRLSGIRDPEVVSRKIEALL